VAVAFSAVAIQAFVVDQAATPAVRHLELPLAVAATLAVAHPTASATIALVFGLSVDAFGHRLFGIHCVAYAVLGPVAQSVPVPVRRPGPAMAWTAGAAGAAATVVVVLGQALADGGPPPGAVARVVATGLWTGLLASVLGLPLGARAVARSGRAAGRGGTGDGLATVVDVGSPAAHWVGPRHSAPGPGRPRRPLSPLG
jgi:hypothetical protein